MPFSRVDRPLRRGDRRFVAPCERLPYSSPQFPARYRRRDRPRLPPWKYARFRRGQNAHAQRLRCAGPGRRRRQKEVTAPWSAPLAPPVEARNSVPLRPRGNRTARRTKAFHAPAPKCLCDAGKKRRFLTGSFQRGASLAAERHYPVRGGGPRRFFVPTGREHRI